MHTMNKTNLLYIRAVRMDETRNLLRGNVRVRDSLVNIDCCILQEREKTGKVRFAAVTARAIRKSAACVLWQYRRNRMRREWLRRIMSCYTLSLSVAGGENIKTRTLLILGKL